jgi:hypothetical protein
MGKKNKPRLLLVIFLAGVFSLLVTYRIENRIKVRKIT